MRSLIVFILALPFAVLTCSDKKPSGPTVTEDTTPPARITTIWICDSEPTWADLCWYAVGDDSLTGKAQSYDIRLSTAPIAESNFSSRLAVEQSLEPRAPKVGERLRITGLDSGVVYFVAIKVSDDAGNWSAMSAIVAVNARDSVPPTTITDLDGYLVNDSTLRLIWTAPRDSETVLPVWSYDIRYSSSQIDTSNWPQAFPVGPFPTPEVPGTLQYFTADWPSADSTLFFAIRSRDNAGNYSALSNLTQIDFPEDSIIIIPDTTVGMEVVWERECGDRLNQTPVDMVTTPDGGMVIVSGWSNGSNQDIVIVKLDSIGDQDWESRIDGGKSEWAAAIFVHPSGDYLVAGSSNSFTDSLGDIYIAKISPSGTLLEDRSFGRPGQESIHGATMLEDGSLVLVGSTTTAVPASVALVVRTDPSGNELWRDHIISYNSCWDVGQYGYAYAEDVAVTTAGVISVSVHEHYVVITGHSGCGPPEEVVSLCRWTLDGIAVSRTDYGPTGFLDGNYPGDVAALPNGNIVACMTAAAENYSFRIECMNPTGGTVWSLLLSGLETQNTKIVPLPETDFVIAAGTIAEGGYWYWGAPADPEMVLIDQLGNPQAFLKVGVPGMIEQCFAATATGSNSFAFAWRKPSLVSERLFITKAKITQMVK